MLRISDGRMSGTAGGTIVLHVSPESADLESVFGIVQNGDTIVCDVEKRSLNLQISGADIKRRIEARRAKAVDASNGTSTEVWLSRQSQRGYRGLYERNVNQADEGCDFDFLTARGPGGRSMD
jgi:dihydroxy-acid dehydratase